MVSFEHQSCGRDKSNQLNDGAMDAIQGPRACRMRGNIGVLAEDGVENVSTARFTDDRPPYKIQALPKIYWRAAIKHLREII